MSAGPVQDWFHNAVLEGVQRLYALNLPDRPAAEVLQLTAATWIEVLWALLPWDESCDAWRLPVAFRDLAASVDRWPAPKSLRAHLPARRAAGPALAHQGSPAPPAVAAKLAETIKALRVHGIDRRQRHLCTSGNISPGDQPATDADGSGME